MARKQNSISAKMLFGWFLLAGFIILIAPRSFTSKLQFAFARLFCWPLGIGRNIALAARKPQLPGGAGTRREAQLQNYIANLEEQLRLKQERIEFLSGLRERFYDLQGAGLKVANVLKASIDSSHGTLMINQGADDGLAPGQFVLGDNSVIGLVCEAAKREARVRLFTDPASRMEVKIEGLDIYRVIEGIGGNAAKIRMVPAKHKLKKGLWVYARGKPGRLNSPIIIGMVADCVRDSEKPFIWDITVTPASDLEQLEHVAVIIINP
ncbi:MAG: rod shape-determining protein MreC [Planctomycetota bacterium]|jgi:rod shape-determining protein MreC